ncbi:MAG: S9 family peptidase, partial [Cyanobacteria bacterium P01_G01_bin.38]
MPPEFQYPNSRKVEQVDTYHGVTVPDPYRWLEDPNADDTQAWVEAQNEVSFGYLKSLPGVEQLRTRLTELWNYERFSTPFKRGGRYFFYKNDGLQNQSVLYTLPTLEAQPTVLLDPNSLSADGTVALSGTAISENGQYLAYGLSSAGSDWMEWRVRRIETGEDLDDSLKWIKFSGASWTHDNQGFFYSRYDEPKQGTQFEDVNYYQKLFYHQVGTPQSADVLIYERPDQKEWGFSGNVTDDGRYLLISVWRGTEQKNLVFYKDLQDSNGAVIELISDFEAQYGFINNEATTFWFQTDLEAPKGRVIAIDITQPDQKQEIIPEAEETLESVSLLNHQFVADYLKDAYTTLKIFDLKGNFVRTVELPGIGSAGGFDGKKDDIDTFYSFTSFTAPGRIYRYNMETGESTLFREATVNFDPSQYETQQVFYTGKDGTRIPMFI